MPRTPRRTDAAVPLAFAVASLGFFRYWAPPPHPLLLCPFRWLTSLPCPLCGMMRALSALCHGEVQRGLALHPLSPLVLLLLVAIAAGSACRLAGYSAPEPWRAPRFWPVTSAIFLAFGILRLARLTL